ncbi:lysylphosphatidylglycerol synthase domain-containing protein [Oleiagrimonas sp. C23AA]|uniref:lysylphosphatidylglycerol synthase domain-containing protein n=1 Tax=Oleiagrimonas sp. C23AA TaxID=2719047 RepID=UPI0014235EDF|nr:lysylphosphatidylglycerol synthase domain-containing protein [Oleiagrimonas sp. C23AA]NII10340.1 UPF0104 family protein [Oleiagrimonas sp. C23AA]
MQIQFKKMLGWVVALAVLVAATVALKRILSTMRLEDLESAFAATHWSHIALAALGTAVSFAVLGLYERYATRMAVPGKVRFSTAMFIGMVGNAFSNTLGFHWLTGSALRYRAYRKAGVGVGDIARIISLVGLCVGLGSVVIVAAALLIDPQGGGWRRWIGVAMAVGLVGIDLALPKLMQSRWLARLQLPAITRPGLALQMLFGLVEMSGAIFAFYVLLPADVVPDFIGFIPVFIMATLLGVVSHSPGGVGVFEATLLTALPSADKAQVLAAALLYRLVYNLLPFTLSMLAVALRRGLSHAQETSVGRRV